MSLELRLCRCMSTPHLRGCPAIEVESLRAQVATLTEQLVESQRNGAVVNIALTAAQTENAELRRELEHAKARHMAASDQAGEALSRACTPAERRELDASAALSTEALENFGYGILPWQVWASAALARRSEPTSGPGDESAPKQKLCPRKDCAIIGPHEHFDIGGQFRTRPTVDQEATGTRCPLCRYPDRCGDERCMRNGCCGHGKDDE